MSNQDYIFRNAKDEEKESYITYLVETVGHNRHTAEEIADEQYLGIIEANYGHPFPVGELLIVLGNKTTDAQLYEYGDEGLLEEVL